MFRDNPCYLGSMRCNSTIPDKVRVVMSAHKHIEMNGTALRRYYAISEVTINHEKCVGLRLYTWTNKVILSNYVVGYWTDGPVKLFGF